jgi:hypothetical protein
MTNPNAFIFNLYYSSINTAEPGTEMNIKIVLLQKMEERGERLEFELHHPVVPEHRRETITLGKLKKDTVELEDKIGGEGLPERYMHQFMVSLRSIL